MQITFGTDQTTTSLHLHLLNMNRHFNKGVRSTNYKLEYKLDQQRKFLYINHPACFKKLNDLQRTVNK